METVYFAVSRHTATMSFVAPERRPVVGWEGLYEVDSSGSIHSLPRVIYPKTGGPRPVLARRRKAVLMRIGYYQVVLCGPGGKETWYVHRIVALAFIGAPDKGRDHVNHINGVKSDNRVENLEWVSRSENLKHSYRVLGQVGAATGKFGVDNKCSLPVVGVPVDGSLNFQYFAGLQEAGRAGFSPGNICSCLHGDRHTHKGFRWYVQGDLPSQQTLVSSRAVIRGVPPGCRLT